LFAFLQPSLRSFTLPQAKESILKTFLQDVHEHNTINPKLFWETREFYAPGNFVLKKQGFSEDEFRSILSNIHTDIHKTGAHPFLTFHSSKWDSVEVLVPAKKIEDVIKSPKFDAKKIVLNSDSELIYYTNHNTLKIYFIRPVDTMKKVNGFLDYGQYDLDILKDKNWLVISEVRL
jgi:hypothetical protein